MRTFAVILALAVLASTPALGQTPADAPVATANGTSPPSSTPAQIEAFLAPSADRGLDDQDLDATLEDGPRKIHGVIDLSVGTGGYRGGRVAVDVPIGERSNLALSYGRAESDNGYVGGYPGHPYDDGSRPLSFGSWSDAGSMRALDCRTDVRSAGGFREGSLTDRLGRGADHCPLR